MATKPELEARVARALAEYNEAVCVACETIRGRQSYANKKAGQSR
jgi:hypothetical protein